MFKHITSITAAAAVGVACLAGSATALAGQSASSHHSSASAASSPACVTADLKAHLTEGSPGAGQRYATLTLRNVSAHSCHTYGYVGMGFLGAHNRKLLTDVIRDHSTKPHVIVLRPGQRATTQLHWDVVDGSGVCVAPRRVEITPPDDTRHLTINWTGDTVCQNGRVDVTPLVHAR